MLIYKIFRPAEWADFEASGIFHGSPDDRRDGFIHCSTADQVSATARRFFSGETTLVVGVFDAARLGDDVRWEPASNRQPYPHIFRSVNREEVVAVHEVAGADELESHISGRPPEGG